MVWTQKSIRLPPKPRGFHLVTKEINSLCPEIKEYKIGLFHLFVQHTSASITINENADSTVRMDMETVSNRLVPEDAKYKHDYEGKDDMPAHVKSSLFGSSILVPITNGKLNLGNWQGIWFNEHRDNGGSRNFVVTIQGQ